MMSFGYLQLTLWLPSLVALMHRYFYSFHKIFTELVGQLINMQCLVGLSAKIFFYNSHFFTLILWLFTVAYYNKFVWKNQTQSPPFFFYMYSVLCSVIRGMWAMPLNQCLWRFNFRVGWHRYSWHIYRIAPSVWPPNSVKEWHWKITILLFSNSVRICFRLVDNHDCDAYLQGTSLIVVLNSLLGPSSTFRKRKSHASVTLIQV